MCSSNHAELLHLVTNWQHTRLLATQDILEFAGGPLPAGPHEHALLDPWMGAGSPTCRLIPMRSRARNMHVKAQALLRCVLACRQISAGHNRMVLPADASQQVFASRSDTVRMVGRMDRRHARCHLVRCERNELLHSVRLSYHTCGSNRDTHATCKP
jgi:hypothetical protein